MHRQLRNWFDGEGIAWVDLLEVYRGRRSLDLWVHPTDNHPNELAQALAAQAIFVRLREQLPR